MAFRAFRVEKNESGFVRSVIERDVEDLPEGEVLIDVQYSSLNYKDALSATGNPGVTRAFPHTPGIDAAGSVLASTDTRFAEGDAVVVIGFDLGMGTSGGFAERIRVPANWVVKLPEGLTARESMLIGTAGFTAAECVQKLEQAGMTPDSGPILVTGATGGVGSVAVKLLATLGYEVAAVTGKPEQHDWLRSLGASELLTREAAAEGAEKPLLAERWGGVVDTVGGDILFNGVKSLRYGCSLAACGLVAAPQFGASVLPFILRHVNLLGIDSVQLPLPQKTQIWSRLATDWKLDLSELEETLSLHDLSAAIDRILAGQMVGRGLVDLSL
ncbi:MAG: YhdH/YhfP family quinone oxidoreductase [Pseudomonadota bacterium]|nr:YhdH/YhfP family quinone oxidoreductase [Pseudomonadota bacterium]MEC8500887.1 YhdH/YhfP family quinone oxidoreductase [Pseudomonadota bacterium]